MSEPRLKTKIWVQSAVKRCLSEGVGATVARKGDEDAGAVALKLLIVGLGCEVLTQARNKDGELGWYRASGPNLIPETEADALLSREVGYDRDLWIVEIEDHEGRRFFGGEIVE